jgi:ribosomal protein S18 acetylase RimI-like enzyme
MSVSVIFGDIFAVMKKVRDEGIVKSLDSLVAQRGGGGKGDSALDLLIEAGPGDGGGGDGGKRHPYKASTRLYLLVKGKKRRVVSMARVVVYSSRRACDGPEGLGAEDLVGVVSAVVTDEKHRRKGFAKQVMESVLADTHPMNLALSAATKGAGAKELYRSVGFVQGPGATMVMQDRTREWWMTDAN